MNKYRNRRVILYGVTFDSIGEAKRYRFLRAAEAAGKIKNLRRQVEYTLIPSFTADGHKYMATKYIADFVYTAGDAEVVEDFKGVKTPVYMIKKKLMAWLFGCTVHEIKKWNQALPVPVERT